VQLFVVMYAYVISREGVIVQGEGVMAQKGECPRLSSGVGGECPTR
jgi:hypothetical protein